MICLQRILSLSYHDVDMCVRALGDQFKWLLYGDDDTFFFIDAVLKTVENLDPEIPYFLTGAITVCNCSSL